MRSLYEDLRYAIRVLRGSPGFTAVAVLTLALGIAANTTVFGWIDALLVRPFPGVAGGGRLAALETVSPSGEYSNTSYRDYRDYRDSLKSFSGLAASLLNAFNVGPADNPRRIYGEYVSGNYFAVLGVKPVRGRAFLPSEYGDNPGASPVAVISYRLWQSLFQGDPGVVGRTIRVNRYELTVAGIAPEEFRGTMPGMLMEIWIPMSMAPLLNGQGDWLLEDRGARQMWVTARLKPGVALEQANAEVEACARRLAEESPQTSRGFRASLMPVWKAHLGMQSMLLAPLRILMAVCFVLFLIVGANVANLQLARATARRRELSVRMALGASRWRLARQLLTESLLLAAMGALAGIPLAAWLGRSLALDAAADRVSGGVRFQPECGHARVYRAVVLRRFSADRPGARRALGERRFDGGSEGRRAERDARRRPEPDARAAGDFGSGAGAGGAGGHRAVRAELSERAGHPSGLRRAATSCSRNTTSIRSARTRSSGRSSAYRLRDRISALPGIAGVSFANSVPLEIGTGQRSDIQVEGYAPGPSEEMQRVERHGRAGLFRHSADSGARRARLHGTGRPRYRAGGDRQSDLRAALLRRRATRWGAGCMVDGAWSTVAGLVKDSKYHRLTEPPTPYIYLPYRQRHGGEFWTAFFIRTVGPARGSFAAVRREAAAIDPNAGVAEVVEFEEMVAGSLYAQKVAAALLSVLGAVSLLLAALGMYSVLAYAVSQRAARVWHPPGAGRRAVRCGGAGAAPGHGADCGGHCGRGGAGDRGDAHGGGAAGGRESGRSGGDCGLGAVPGRDRAAGELSAGAARDEGRSHGDAARVVSAA